MWATPRSPRTCPGRERDRISGEKAISDVITALRRVEQEVAASRIRPFRNLVGEPYVNAEVPPEQGRPGLPRIVAHVGSPDFKGWLSLFLWEREEILLRERELGRILEVLRALTLRSESRTLTDPDLCRVLEDELVVVVVLEFMHTPRHRRYEQKMGRLWEELEEFARRRGQLTRGRSRFPAGANVLSRKLARWADVLERLGVRVTMHRSNGCNVVLERLDDTPGEPPVNPIPNNPVRPNPLPASGGADDLLAALRAKHRSLNHSPDEGDKHHG